MTYTIASSCVCTSPLAVMTVVGPHDFVKVSISALLRYFLLIMCIDAPESTKNSLSSGLRVDASRHLFSKSEKNAALRCSFNFDTFLASFHATSRAPCSCHSVSSSDRSSNFLNIGATLMRFTWANHSERRISVTNFSLTRNGFCEFYTSDRFPHVCALPENKIRRIHILKYATHLSCTWWVSVIKRFPCSWRLLFPFRHSHCIFVTILFRPFASLFFNLAMHKEHCSPNLQPLSDL